MWRGGNLGTTHMTPSEYKRRAARHVPECDTQSAILDWLAIMKVRAVRIDTSGQPVYGKGGTVAALRTCSHVGTPDILAFLPWGQACAIEVKREGEGRTGLRFSQARWIVETAKLSPGTMILIAESMLDVEQILKPMMDAWRDGAFNANPYDTPAWFQVTAAAVATAKQRIAKGPQ